MAFSLIRNGTLIDGRGGAPVKNAAILIEDRHIVQISTESEYDTAVVTPRGVEIEEIDAQGGTILPGFIDTHVHLLFEGFNIPQLMAQPFSLMFFQAAEYLRRTLEAGITSVRDAGGADMGVKQAVEQGLVVGPRVQISITPMTITGGHGDGWMLSGNLFDLMVPHPGAPDGCCDGVEEVRRKTREILRAGAEVLKVHATGGVLSPTDHPEFTQFSFEELSVMVQEGAARRGVKVMAHAQGAEGVKNAIRAGIHSIEHGIFLDEECIQLMLEHGTFLVPTLLALVGVLEGAEQTGAMPEWGIAKAREVIGIHKQNIARAYEAGVRIAMGTDTGVTAHGDNLRELALMCEIGMSPMEAIMATTSVAAECMGWESQVGTVDVGKLADMVICRADPLADIRVLENRDHIVMVMKDGQVVKDLLGR